MNVLIIGQGGREHALAWKIAQSHQVNTVFVAPGNAGTAREAKIKNIAIDATNTVKLCDFAKKNNIALTLVGPEQPLVQGLVDHFEREGLPVLGPCAKAAQLEGSKSFCKDFLARHDIPTADYQSFDNIQAAIAHAQDSHYPLVIKADGLAAGKGVVICENKEQAQAELTAMLTQEKFGEAGHKVVIETFLTGEEASFMILVDAEYNYIPFASSQDHKRIGEGDTGLNTGGMGAYSPAPVVTDTVHQRVIEQIIEPTLQGLKSEGIRYQGFLYAGLMIDAQGQPSVIEFNCRLGDPETQPLLIRLQSDFFELCQAAVTRGLKNYLITFDPRPALGVVLASHGYPESYPKGQPIQGSTQPIEHGKIFHAGTAIQDGHLVTQGGRVLCVCTLGDSIAQARERAYHAAEQITWDALYYRRDIGYRAL